MILTRISIRGKRGQPKKSKKASTERTELADMVDQPETRRIRSKKHHTQSTNHIDGMLAQNASRLLRLPQEVLELVFVASKNLSLPLVNRELRRRLSTASTKHQLVGAAFGPTWDAMYGLDVSAVRSHAGADADADASRVDVDRLEGDPAFQSCILARSWAKIDMLLASYDIWIRRHARGRVYFTPGLVNLRTPPRPMSMRQKFAFDVESFQRIIAGTEHQAHAHGFLEALLAWHHEVHPGASIPEDLLMGPYESEDDGSIALGEEKARRLLWLVRGGAGLQDKQTWETTNIGFQAVLNLVRGSMDEGVSQADCDRRLALAMLLFHLFRLVGVFHIQWPEYMHKVHLGVVATLISKAPSGSKQESALAVVSTSFRRLGPCIPFRDLRRGPHSTEEGSM